MIAIAKPIEAVSPLENPGKSVAGLQKTVSASRLSLFLSCRLKFFFRYVLRLKKPKTPALHVGGSVHATLKAWNKARWRGQPFALKQLHDAFVKAWDDESEGPVQWNGDKEEEKSTAWRLLETYDRQIHPTEKPDAVEVPVEADLHSHGLPAVVGI